MTSPLQLLTKISKCRACRGNLVGLFSLGEQYVIEYPKSKGGSLKAPLNLTMCVNCGLVQLEHSVNPDRLFSEFWYRSSLSPTMRSSLKEIADSAIREVKFENGKTSVLDIGSNDGTLLRFFGGKVRRLGFEPSNLASKGSDSGQIIKDFFSVETMKKSITGYYGGAWADVITSIAMFYDLENPIAFVKDISTVLKPEGVWIDQQNYLGSMVAFNGFDNIVHEHLTYFSLKSFINILASAKLMVYRVELNDVNGGSFRSYVCHKGERKVEDSVIRQLDWEEKAQLENPETYRRFFERICFLREQTVGWINELVKDGEKIFVLGAGTRGNTILQFYGLDESLVKGAVDRNRDKWGLKVVGTDIPIMSRKDADPDYFLVLPYHFLAEFKEEEKDWLANGGKFIVPLPDLRFVP